jgi:hypothetical protein
MCLGHSIIAGFQFGWWSMIHLQNIQSVVPH